MPSPSSTTRTRSARIPRPSSVVTSVRWAWADDHVSPGRCLGTFWSMGSISGCEVWRDELSGETAQARGGLEPDHSSVSTSERAERVRWRAAGRPRLDHCSPLGALRDRRGPFGVVGGVRIDDGHGYLESVGASPLAPTRLTSCQLPTRPPCRASRRPGRCSRTRFDGRARTGAAWPSSRQSGVRRRPRRSSRPRCRRAGPRAGDEWAAREEGRGRRSHGLRVPIKRCGSRGSEPVRGRQPNRFV